MKKISTYQKLKAENLKLRQDIYTILKGKNVEDVMTTTQKYILGFNLEEAIWAGSYNSTPLAQENPNEHNYNQERSR